MDEKINPSPAENEHYAAVGEEIIRQQGLPVDDEGAPPQSEPVKENPADEDIYKEPPPPPAPAGEYASFGADVQEAVEEELAAESEPEPVVEEPAKEEAPAAGTPPAKKESGDLWQTILRPIVALLAICLVTSLLLGLTNNLTAPIIASNAAAADDAARKALLPEADGFEEVAVPDGLDDVTSIYRATNDVGWIIGAYGRGYGGKVPALVAFDENGDIAGVTFTENSETVGLGQKVREPEFYEQFAGRPAENLTLGDVDKIASATISTNAALSAVNAAIDAYGEVSGNGGGTAAHPTETADVLEFLLPGEALTPITISAQNVQPTAYRGENGDYIIFGEKPPEGQYGGVVVAGVAMNSDGEILNLWLDTSGESEGYGTTLATNQSFIQSFIGQTAPAQVDAVTDITNSSNSVMAAVNNALGALPLAKEAA